MNRQGAMAIPRELELPHDFMMLLKNTKCACGADAPAGSAPISSRAG
jgi:hypothetical protein